MRFALLGSGSRGNATVVEAGGTRILLDCGFGTRETVRRLARLGLVPEDLLGIVVTHEHTDHIAGASKFADRHGLTLWMSHGTQAGAGLRVATARIEIIDSHRCFAAGALEIQPFPVPHDAREPVQFVFADGRHRVGILTDAGSSTPHIERMLSGCDALVVECNHDAAMLQAGSYPPALKRRIGGRFGHLDNASAAGLMAVLDTGRLKHVVAAHLSEQNNTPALARAALAHALGCTAEWIDVATQDDGLGWRELA